MPGFHVAFSITLCANRIAVFEEKKFLYNSSLNIKRKYSGNFTLTMTSINWYVYICFTALDENNYTDEVKNEYVLEGGRMLNLDRTSILKYVRDSIIGKDASFEGPFGVRKGKPIYTYTHMYI